MAPSRAPLSSDSDPEFPSYGKAHIKSTSFGTRVRECYTQHPTDKYYIAYLFQYI